jgi:superfamily II DNA or RNA helicase
MKSNRFYKKPILKKLPESNIFTISDSYKETIRINSYLGKKGYTIPKSYLSKEDDEYLRKDLFVKPEVFGPNFGGAQTELAFPVFRENSNKLYIPRFYGIARYGLPYKSEIQEGDDISVEFSKPLRDYQEEIISTYMNYVQNPICNGSLQNGSGGILEVPCGRGKCLGKDTPILMYDGTIKLVQDIRVGDQIMGDDSTPRNVLTLARGREMMYKVKSKKGDGYIVNESHILSLKTNIKINKNKQKGSIIDISVLDFLDLPKSYHGRSGPLLGYRVPITFQEKEVENDPYLFGYWLGDNTPLNNSANKHIPLHYKCNSRIKQLHLLAGIIDSAGYYYNSYYEVVHKNESLMDDIIFLARSLGFACFKIMKTKKIYTNEKNEPVEEIYYQTNISGFRLEEIPVKYPDKKAKPRELLRDVLKYRINLEKLEIDDYYGFEIDGNHRFVLGDFTVTHNTVMALKIIAQIKKKTLILVHKEFLMNQWIERIGEFLTGAKIGKIQAQVIDVEGKDIVIGMIQTLYDKEFPTGTFDNFGLTIIDEVHRIGSEQFSKTLFKTITPYMLGISATVERKDKLTKILYMYIGEKIYEEKRENDDPVCVRAIEYKTNNSEFNETDLDFRGNPKYSSMIVKLCEYGPRSDFIIRIIKDLIEEEPEKQIMILCHNRSLLSYLYEGITYRKIASVGYYVGGMKQTNLQETETKNIVLATYAMAAEALDIKTLSTLVMVTPKTDITQSVGRILRVKHEKPIIIDIIDSHDMFQKQWTQRRRFYKKANYRIRQIDSIKYTNMSIDWEEDKTWKRVFEPKTIDNLCQPKLEEDIDEELIDKPIIGKCLIKLDNIDMVD